MRGGFAMTTARFGALLGLIAVFLTLALGAAGAVETGTHAWTKRTGTLYEGPGQEYDVLGTIGENLEVRVDRCSWNWCQIHSDTVRGWTPIATLSFGQTARGPWQGEKFGFGAGAGTVCLYSGRDYSGTEVCRPSGTVMRDLLLYDMDNTFSSVRISGNASVTLCRDRFFKSYCERVNESQPQLQGFLDNNVSSVRIY